MSLLLSQASPFDWEKMLMTQGPLYVVFLLIVWLVVWYGPGLVSGHKRMMVQVGDASETTAACIKKMESRQGTHEEALLHIVEAGIDGSSCPSVKGHLVKARATLEKNRDH